MAIFPIIKTSWHSILALLSPIEQRCEQCGRLYTNLSSGRNQSQRQGQGQSLSLSLGKEQQRIMYRPLTNQSQHASSTSPTSAYQYAHNHPTIGTYLATYLPLCNKCQSTIPWKQQIYCLICGRGDACADCSQRAQRYFVCNRSSVQYDERMKEWLALYKYRGDERLQERLSAMLLASFYQLTDEVMLKLGMGIQRRARDGHTKVTLHDCWDAITYVPLSATRLAERGFNQAEQLANWLAVQHDLPLVEAIKRVKHSTKMSMQSRVGRVGNITDVFAACEEQLRLFAYFLEIKRKERQRRASQVTRLLLVDDVYTTGTTVNACAQAILQASQRCGLEQVEIYVLTWARS